MPSHRARRHEVSEEVPPNVTPFATRFALIKLMMGAHMAPPALLFASTQHVGWQVAVAGILCVLIGCSPGFRFLYSEFRFFRYSMNLNVTAQLLGFAIATTLLVNWPAVVAFCFAFICAIANVSRTGELARLHFISE